MLGIRSFRASPEFDSLPLIFDFLGQLTGLCGANKKLRVKNNIVNINTKIKRKVILLI